MSFTISLHKTTSPANSLTKGMTNVYSFTGTLKEGSSLVDPIVMVEHDGAITGVNYAHIAAFGRYYYIKDIRNVYNNMWEITLHSDALTSFASEIRACHAVVAKNENSFNLYLNDNNFRCYQNPIIIQKAFPNGFNYNNFSFVIAIAGDKELA